MGGLGSRLIHGGGLTEGKIRDGLQYHMLLPAASDGCLSSSPLCAYPCTLEVEFTLGFSSGACPSAGPSLPRFAGADTREPHPLQATAAVRTRGASWMKSPAPGCAARALQASYATASAAGNMRNASTEAASDATSCWAGTLCSNWVRKRVSQARSRGIYHLT